MKNKGEGKMEYLNDIGKRAKAASSVLAKVSNQKKNEALLTIADALIANQESILRANELDVKKARENGMKESLIDRLAVNEARILGMAGGLRKVAALDNPVGEVLSMKQRPNGLMIGEKVVPLGVIGMIYESRPNVTVDAFSLCFKTGNAVILRGGSDCIQSNIALVKVIRSVLKSLEIHEDVVILLEDTSRETATKFMQLNQYVDVLIPRGGANLIRSVVQNSTIPVIETGTGNCHVYVDESADFDMALDIIENAKLQRLGVCNACESLLVHEAIANEFLPLLYQRLASKEVEIRADEASRQICEGMTPATEEDWGMEYLDKIISLKIVSSIDEAIAHINRYNTKHSEAIITKDYANSMQFLDEVDAAAVYVNASTRFTDGEEFGFGAEIGISTQKLHVRGPMGLRALTTTKYIVFGNGQIR